MPSFNIHLAIARKYCEKHEIKNKEEFYRGSIDPDLVTDKSVSHYTGKRDKNYLEEFLYEKVRLDKFLENQVVDSEYKLALFLHLATDYIFFNGLFEREYIRNISYDDFIQDLYHSYYVTNVYLEEKYRIHDLGLDEVMNTNIKNTLKRMQIDNTHGNNILPEEKLESFIEYMSDLDVEKYIEKIKKENKNVLP